MLAANVGLLHLIVFMSARNRLQNKPDLQLVILYNLVFSGKQLFHVPRATEVPSSKPLAPLLSQENDRISSQFRLVRKP